MQIKTGRLILRDFTQNDYDFFYKLEKDKFTIKFERDTIPTKDEIDKSFNKILESISKNPRTKYSLLITTLDNMPVGRVVMWEIDSSIKEWEIGWFMHPDHIGKGYAPESAKALLEYAFNHLGLHRVQALCNEENTNSEKVMMKIGMQKEGTIRATRKLKNRWVGMHVYSILDSDLQSKRVYHKEDVK